MNDSSESSQPKWQKWVDAAKAEGTKEDSYDYLPAHLNGALFAPKSDQKSPPSPGERERVGAIINDIRKGMEERRKTN